ncbi:NAD(+) synthase [Candidatus Daviesbacteria bacterium]|nr:NAD(+) synthase [Candidatus Daviesbacteria bacterium]
MEQRIEKPLSVPTEQISSLYRFSKRLDDVNWSARYKPNRPFLEGLVPHMQDFLDRNIRKITYDNSSLRAVVGISGGLDSSVSATLVADTITQAQDKGTIQNSSLVLIAFQGMSEEDLESARKFAELMGSKYTNIPIDYQERDLSKLLRDLDSFTEDLIFSTRKPKVYSGELTSRVITPIIMEYADRIGHCAIDSTNGTEYILGEIVIGAEAECAPIADFYKSQVYDLADLISVPKFVVNRPPINSTWGHDKVATYFAEKPEGLTPREAYQLLDPVLYYLFERRYQPSTVAKRLGHSLEFVSSLATRIKDQDHRRDIPFFVVNDRFKKYPRAVKSRTNEEMQGFMKDSLAIAG